MKLPGSRVLVGIWILWATAALTACATGQHEQRSLVPPDAPAQELAPTAASAKDIRAGTPIAQLADPDWIATVSETTGIGPRALQAYAGASLRISQVYPGCGLGWNTLAGLSQVESFHGTYGGSNIGAEGNVEPRIIGIALDGSPGVMAIEDTDGGALDADERWDRAVGPLQFIPTTWKQYAQDGNVDGVTDPHQIDDAALTAAHYLCQHERDVSTTEGWNSAVGSYNRSVQYANDVASYAVASIVSP